MEVRKGYVEHIVFRNNDHGYTVFQMVSEEEELTCVGLFSVLAEGELVQVSGYMKEHPLYGEQLQVEQYELLAPEDEIAMERYLGSGAIKGIGAAAPIPFDGYACRLAGSLALATSAFFHGVLQSLSIQSLNMFHPCFLLNDFST